MKTSEIFNYIHRYNAFPPNVEDYDMQTKDTLNNTITFYKTFFEHSNKFYFMKQFSYQNVRLTKKLIIDLGCEVNENIVISPVLFPFVKSIDIQTSQYPRFNKFKIDIKNVDYITFDVKDTNVDINILSREIPIVSGITRDNITINGQVMTPKDNEFKSPCSNTDDVFKYIYKYNKLPYLPQNCNFIQLDKYHNTVNFYIEYFKYLNQYKFMEQYDYKNIRNTREIVIDLSKETNNDIYISSFLFPIVSNMIIKTSKKPEFNKYRINLGFIDLYSININVNYDIDINISSITTHLPIVIGNNKANVRVNGITVLQKEENNNVKEIEDKSNLWCYLRGLFFLLFSILFSPFTSFINEDNKPKIIIKEEFNNKDVSEDSEDETK